MNSNLIESIINQRLLLFVGAGVSATVGAPTWRGLIEYIAEQLDYDPNILVAPGVNYMALAEYFQIVRGEKGMEALCAMMRDTWNATEQDLKNSQVYKAIGDLDVRTIYTTNFDQNIENALNAFGKKNVFVVRGISDIAKTPLGACEVVKFHGDSSDCSSLVLTERNYFDRLDFEKPLDIKLRYDALGKSILFIGYSMSDINLRLLLYKLHRSWEGDSETSRPKCYLLLQRPNEMEREILSSRGIEVLVRDIDDPNAMLAVFLEDLVRDVEQVRASKANSGYKTSGS